MLSDMNISDGRSVRELAFIQRADTLMRKHGLGGWGLQDMAGALGTVEGVCQLEERILWFQVKRISRKSIGYQTDVVLHEIAHALCPNVNHNIQWARKAESIGMHSGTIMLDLTVAERAECTPELRAAAKHAGNVWLRHMNNVWRAAQERSAS
jgi:hypothetical protein